MKILSIELKNIGLYKNKKLVFNSENKTTTIFWGNNGAGKTTLLNSIKIGLLGSSALHYDYEGYVKFIKESLISSRLESDKKNAYINIEIEIKENNEKNNYSIKRSWNASDDFFEEDVQVFLRNSKLDFLAKEDFLSKIKTILPPSLLDVVIFDGENAINVLNNDQMPKLIKNIIYAIFGMDVYSNLSKDLGLYLRNMNNVDDESSIDQITLIDYENSYKNSYNELNMIKNSISELKRRQQRLILSLNQHNKRIFDKTGVKFDDIMDFKKSLTLIEDNRKNLSEEIKYINEEIIPFKMLHKKIQAVVEQMDKEKPYLVINNINAIKAFFLDDSEAVDMIKNLERRLNLSQDIEIKYNLSNSETSKVYELNKILSQYDKKKLCSYYEDRNSSFSLLKEKMSQVEKLTDSESAQLVENIELLYKEIYDIQDQVIQLEKQEKEKNTVCEENKDKYESLKKTLLLKKKESNSYLNIMSYKETIDEFLQENISDICEELNESILSEIKRIGYRNNSIKNIVISPKTFEVKLYEKDNKLVQSKLFSAGEKQILLGLVIKESLKLSKNDTFFLFDTPVGRLDVKNRSIFTNEVILKISNQSMVFATDSDYSKEDYQSIKEKVTDEFMLARDKNDAIIVKAGSIYEGAK